MDERKNYYSQDNKESVTYSQAKKALEKVQNILDKYNIRIFINGGIIPYLLLNIESNRLHNNIEVIARLKDMKQLREIFKQEGLYNAKRDSLNRVEDGLDYGFEMKIDEVPFGIYPFVYRNEILTQYIYDSYQKKCQTKEIKINNINDYITSYKSLDGKIYDTVRLEYIYMIKKDTNKPKDILDIQAIEKTKILKNDVLEKIQDCTKIKEELSKDINRKAELKELEQMKKQLVETKGKSNVLTLSNNQGFTDALILSILTGFAAGIIFMMAYQIIITT